MRVLLSIIIMALVLCLTNACKVSEYKSDSKAISHEIWDTLLRQHVSENGKVDYKGFIRDSVKFNQYLTLLSQHHPNDQNWSREEQMTYWINAYNAFTVKLIVDHYPTKSIKDIKNGIPFVNTVWDIKFIKIEGRDYDLNNIEHGILRPKYKDPRIHMAINCASISCPKLFNRAYTADKLNEQLDEAARDFVNDDSKNKISADKPKVSSIFNWYGGDFNNVIDFINKYAKTKINKGAKLEYLDYNWGLNEG